MDLVHPSLDARALLRWELEQREQSGYDTRVYREQLERSGGIDEAPLALVNNALDGMDRSRRVAGWPYAEPDELDEIIEAAEWPDAASPVDLDVRYRAAVLRGWTGRVVGNMLGKPVEGWTQDAIRVALTANGEWPLRDYFPGRAEGSIGLDDYVVCWPETTRGNINGSSRDDDVDYTILNLHVLERHGQAASTTAFASAWLELLPYLQTFTAERVAIRNLLRGDDPAVAAAYRNPYREFIGAAIRADVFGYVHPGDPASAARLAYRDAVLSHRGNGVYSEMWCAALVSSAFTARSADEVLSNSLKVVPRRSRLHQAVQEVLDAKRAGLTWDDTMERIAQSWHGHNWVHALVNAAVLSAGIAFGEGNFDDTVTLTVMGGLDTDSNGATAGSVAGILATDIDSRWVDPLKDTVRSAVFGYDGISLSALAGRTAAVAEQFRSGGPTTSAHAAASLPPAAW